MVVLKGWKYVAFVSGIVGFTGCAIYPIIIHPMLYPNYWKEQQKKNRSGIIQENIQPGDMKVWTDPFDRKKST
ncbi:small integral membrane protein 20 [Ctenocephalides felis]|uniref:small integral membrane protein 20 n=1 Tax=Ctenocephalides felis TaxID=7515 RepID=UPI000E6E48D3|nr:small integral membrane protein 20 [Ctenocephalides felis]